MRKQTKNPHCREKFQNPIERGKSIPLTHKYMTTHFRRLVQALQQKVAVLS